MKKALLVRGEPIILEDPEKFVRDTHDDVGIMSRIASHERYDPIQIVGIDSMESKLVEMAGPEDFLFYFTGHANDQVLGRWDIPFHEFFRKIEENYSGRKLLVLDCCTLNLLERADLHFPSNSRIYTGDKVYSSESLAKIFYGEIFAWKEKLDNIPGERFPERKYHWVKFKETSWNALEEERNA